MALSVVSVARLPGLLAAPCTRPGQLLLFGHLTLEPLASLFPLPRRPSVGAWACWSGGGTILPVLYPLSWVWHSDHSDRGFREPCVPPFPL